MQYKPNRWKSGVLGLVGGAVGVMAMDYYFKKAAPAVSQAIQQQKEEVGSQGPEEQPGSEQPESEVASAAASLQDISLVGRQYRDDETSTTALGRIIYSRITGREPESQETKTLLSYLIHWIYGIGQGGVYGAARANASCPDLKGGAAFGTGLWLFGDELAVPMLGLQSGPGAATAEQHVNRAGAHLVYGLATALVTQTLRRIV